MRYAFLARNYRNLNFEKKVIFTMHVATVIACILPWAEFKSVYDDPIIIQNAFGGYHALMGIILAGLSIAIILLFIDRLFEKNAIKLPFSESYLYGGVSLQQAFIIIMIWSVLAKATNDYTDASLRFGIYFALICQVSALVATFLNYQIERTQTAQSFFQQPDKHRFQNEIEE